MKVNIRQISKITGFSPATVSNALNRKKGVNKDTSEIIFRTAKELGYSLDPKNKKIKFLCLKRQGHIINDSPLFSAIISGAEEQAKEYGYQVVFVNLNTLEENYQNQINSIIDDETCSAYIVLGTELKEENYEIFTKITKPIVIIDGASAKYNFDCVVINNSESVQNAVKYLISCGHKEIGYLRGKHRINSFVNRALGYKRAMRAAKLDIVDKYIITLGTNTEKTFNDMCKHIEEKHKLPTAFVADTDLIALGAMRALQKYGYKVPEDISIIGFDNIDFSGISTPRLTTMGIPKEELGRIAVRRIDYKIKHSSPVKTKTLVYTEFVERDSVNKLN